ncbi:putative DNA metabolism protein [Dysgonomonadaceae bacterium PH5-43]|nr:putative DNA metabolism protein [Dysgonomonadaceae bacterium PH5-43]
MLYYIYDKSFEGLLCCVFDSFERKETPDCVLAEDADLPLFSEFHQVTTSDDRSNRVFNGLRNKLSKSALQMLYFCFLSEIDNTETNIFNYMRKCFLHKVSIELNFADDDVLRLSKVYKTVCNEANRLKQFVRFQKTADGIFFAVMDPKCNVLPICSDFFKERYADQPWIIYDTKRNYGLYYNLDSVETVNFDKLPVSILSGKLNQEQQDEDERAFQALWKDYLKAVTINERKNLRLQRQNMPKRFWKYLIEKN